MVTLVVVYVLLTYFIGFHLFIVGAAGHTNKIHLVAWILSPIVVPLGLFLMLVLSLTK